MEVIFVACDRNRGLRCTGEQQHLRIHNSNGSDCERLDQAPEPHFPFCECSATMNSAFNYQNVSPLIVKPVQGINADVCTRRSCEDPKLHVGFRVRELHTKFDIMSVLGSKGSCVVRFREG